jgi:hypothetical protein
MLVTPGRKDAPGNNKSKVIWTSTKEPQRTYGALGLFPNLWGSLVLAQMTMRAWDLGVLVALIVSWCQTNIPITYGGLWGLHHAWLCAGINSNLTYGGRRTYEEHNMGRAFPSPPPPRWIFERILVLRSTCIKKHTWAGTKRNRRAKRFAGNLK